MNFFRGLNKEQWTAIAAAAISALMLLFGFSGQGAPASDAPKSAAEEPYVPLKARYVELPDEKFERYWTGKKIFNTESAVKLPVPVLKAPEPREEEMPVPPFRPGPAWEVYNKLPGTLKYPMLSPGTPAIAEANLPTAAEVADLVKLPEPESTAKPDLRDKKEREFAIIKLKSGAQWEVGEITDPNVAGFVMYKDKAGARKRVSLSEVNEILTNNTNEKQYGIDAAKIQSGPKEVDERLKLAQWCVDRGMMPEARAEAKKAFEAKRDSAEAIAFLGNLAAEASDFETAIATYKAGIDAGASAGELWYEIGRSLRAMAFYEGALAAMEKAVEINPRLHRAKIGLARALLEMGNAQAAADSATDFFTKLGSSPDTTAAHRAEATLVRGLAHLRLGHLEKARSDFAETLKVDPANAEALNGTGAAFAYEGQFPQAGPEFVKAIRANQYHTEAWTNLAALFLLGGKWAEAEQLATAAAQRDPASVEALLSMGLAQLLAGKKDAPATISKAEQMEPRNLLVLMVNGLLQLRAGQDEEALQRFVSALRQEYFYLPAYSGAAAAYLRTARKLEMTRDDASAKKAGELRVNALTLLQAVKNFDENRPGAWVAIGCAYAVMQRPDDARLALRRAPVGDPLTFYARGYIESKYADGDEAARLEAAYREFEQGIKLETTAVDPFSQRVIADCKAAAEAIDLWKKTSLRLLENFDGPESKNIGGGWVENEGQGLVISREKGRGRISGKQAIRDWALTSLSHDIPGDDFYSLEMTFVPEKIDKAEFGLALFHTHQGTAQSGFCIGVDAAGKVRFAPTATNNDLDARDTTVGWTELKTALPNPKEITIRVTLTEKQRNRFLNIFFWSAQKGDWIVAHPPVAVNPPRGTWKVAAWAHAWRDQDVLLFVDNIKVLDQARR